MSESGRCPECGRSVPLKWSDDDGRMVTTFHRGKPGRQSDERGWCIGSFCIPGVALDLSARYRRCDHA